LGERADDGGRERRAGVALGCSSAGGGASGSSAGELSALVPLLRRDGDDGRERRDERVVGSGWAG
jgi:hypothetical protein